MLRKDLHRLRQKWKEEIANKAQREKINLVCADV